MSNLHDLEHDELRAYRKAEWAHAGQERMGTGEPYMVHPRRVGFELKRRGWDTEMVQAGFLHDTLEDTTVTLPEIETEFGSIVAHLVYEMTTPEYHFDPKPDLPGLSARQWRYSQLIEVEGPRLMNISEKGRVIKSIDTMDNVSHIGECGRRDFEREYVGLKWRLVTALYQTIDKSLYTELVRVVKLQRENYFPELVIP